MNTAYELLTVKQAAELLYKSEQGVRRLLKAGELTAIREGGRFLLTLESLQEYAAGLPHPLKVMAAIYEARAHLAAHKSLGGTGWRSCGQDYLTPRVSAYRRHFLPLAVPVCRELLEAVKVKDYAQVEQQDMELWRLRSDYQMLHAPIKTPKTKAQQRERVYAEQPPLFAGSDGGGKHDRG